MFPQRAYILFGDEAIEIDEEIQDTLTAHRRETKMILIPLKMLTFYFKDKIQLFEGLLEKSKTCFQKGHQSSSN